jgi:hypothetical protein
MHEKHIYFVPGRAESLASYPGQLMARRGYAIQGRALTARFGRLPFAEQLAVIRSDAHPAFWSPNGRLVGRSYGAYLLLHALAEMGPFPGKILVCSPVLGAAVATHGRVVFGSRPPRGDKLLELAERQQFPVPHALAIYTGADDHGCDPQLAARFAALMPHTQLTLIAGAGHHLRHDDWQAALDHFLVSADADA